MLLVGKLFSCSAFPVARSKIQYRTQFPVFKTAWTPFKGTKRKRSRKLTHITNHSSRAVRKFSHVSLDCATCQGQKPSSHQRCLLFPWAHARTGKTKVLTSGIHIHRQDLSLLWYTKLFRGPLKTVWNFWCPTSFDNLPTTMGILLSL